MKNYLEFTKLIEDGESMDVYNFMSTDQLKTTLNSLFNGVDFSISEAANTFKIFFRGRDYDEFYHKLLSLLEDLNDIKIILNILYERKEDEQEDLYIF